MGKRLVIEITPATDGWDVRARQGATLSHHDTKEEAIDAGRKAAKEAELGQLVVKGRDGRIQEEFTYGEDPEHRPD